MLMSHLIGFITAQSALTTPENTQATNQTTKAHPTSLFTDLASILTEASATEFLDMSMNKPKAIIGITEAMKTLIKAMLQWKPPIITPAIMNPDMPIMKPTENIGNILKPQTSQINLIFLSLQDIQAIMFQFMNILKPTKKPGPILPTEAIPVSPHSKPPLLMLPPLNPTTDIAATTPPIGPILLSILSPLLLNLTLIALTALTAQMILDPAITAVKPPETSSLALLTALTANQSTAGLLVN